MRYFVFLFSIMFSLSNVYAGKLPNLSKEETSQKIHEIMRSHATCQDISIELVERALKNFISDLDPNKTYFLENEIVKWIEPTEELLQEAVTSYKQKDYLPFYEIYNVIISAIKRHNELEKQISSESLEKSKPIDFKNLKWCKDENELLSHLKNIRSLQKESAQKFDKEIGDQFLQRVNKRRLNKEETILGKNPQDRENFILVSILKATSSAMDSQTAYFTPAEAGQFMIQVQQKLFGIGAQLRDDLNGFSIVHLLEGSPAIYENKLRIGDKIIAVDKTPVVGMELVDAVELIRGPKGSTVLLTILRNTPSGINESTEEKLDIEVTRGEIVLKEGRFTSSWDSFGDGIIAHINLLAFYQDSESSSSEDLKKEIETLKSKYNLKGIILDLRNNSGGLLPQAVSVSGLFLKKGVIVSVKDNTGEVVHLRNVEGKPIWTGPLIVLTNKTSASAAEIVAQTIQDYGRALVVGDEQTYGKGTFQTFTVNAAQSKKINPKGEYKVTRGRYYTVSGKSPQLIGVKPDIVVPGPLSNIEIGEKFSKYPLGSDVINPDFDDDLSDIPPMHKAYMANFYKKDLQQIITSNTALLPLLRQNSEQRISANKGYQKFIKELTEKEDPDSAIFNLFDYYDLQLAEAKNILKDLILLSKNPSEDVEVLKKAM